MSLLKFLSCLSACFIFLSSVDAKQESTEGISWLKSGMPVALQQAKKQNQPLFVYWGAVWCPPCNVVKTTIFNDSKFIQSTRDYVSVYLDGDTEEAQKWGQKLKVMGYPTLMILSPDGKEVLRLSPSNTVEDLVSTMDYSKNMWNPITDVLTQVLSAKNIDAKKIHSLAMYSWSQDKDVSEAAKNYSQKLFALDKKLKESQLQKDRAILFLTALSLKFESLEDDQKLAASEKTQYKNRVKAILNNPELLQANIMNLAYEAENLVSQLTQAKDEGLSDERSQFIQLYLKKMRQYRGLKGLTFDHYYSTFSPSIDFADKFKIELDKSDKKQLIDYTAKTLPITTESKARQAMLSDASYMLFKYGLKDQAKQLLTTELNASSNPYYLMSTLGFFEKEDDNSELALQWYEKAYLSAKGPATKLQWYGSYIRNLIKLKPENKESIKSHVSTLLDKYTYMADSFWGRNYRVLLSVKKSTSKWAGENDEISWKESLQLNGLKKCSLSSKEVYKTSCEKFYKEFI